MSAVDILYMLLTGLLGTLFRIDYHISLTVHNHGYDVILLPDMVALFFHSSFSKEFL